MAVKPEDSPEEYAAYWGSDSWGDKPPRKLGDGALFYNFAQDGYDQNFLWKFLCAINRTLIGVKSRADRRDLNILKGICIDRICDAVIPEDVHTPAGVYIPNDLHERSGADLADVITVTERVTSTILKLIEEYRRNKRTRKAKVLMADRLEHGPISEPTSSG